MRLREHQRRGSARLLNASGLVLWTASTIIGTADVNTALTETSTLPALCPVQIEMSATALDSLRAAPRKYVRAKVTVLGEIFDPVGVHLKGSQGSVRGIDEKPSFTLDFAKYDPVKRFKGLAKIHLNNSVEDATFLNEQIGSALFAAAGVPAPRVAHARVSLNGRALGLYVLKEGFAEEFLARYFARVDGNFYDIEQGHDVDQIMKRSIGQPSEVGQPDLQRLSAVSADPNLERRWRELNQVLDVDKFLAFMALEIMVCHWDGYCLGRNNFRIYHDPVSDRMVFLPAGMDQLFGKADMPWRPAMAGVVAQAILDVPEGEEQYRAKFNELFARLFVSRRITRRVQQLLDDLRPFLSQTEFRQIKNAAAELCDEVVNREHSLRRQLSRPPPARVEFHGGVATLGDWQATDESTGGHFDEVRTPDGRAALWIHAGSQVSSSFRTTVRLPPGSYEFQGEARVANVVPLPFGRNQGAALRLSGGTRPPDGLVGTCGWTPLKQRFAILDAEAEVTFICELRAAAGDGWFDKHSLRLVRAP